MPACAYGPATGGEDGNFAETRVMGSVGFGASSRNNFSKKKSEFLRVWAVLLALGLGPGESAVAGDPATACIAKGTDLVASLAAGDATKTSANFDAP